MISTHSVLDLLHWCLFLGKTAQAFFSSCFPCFSVVRDAQEHRAPSAEQEPKSNPDPYGYPNPKPKPCLCDVPCCAVREQRWARGGVHGGVGVRPISARRFQRVPVQLRPDGVGKDAHHAGQRGGRYEGNDPPRHGAGVCSSARLETGGRAWIQRFFFFHLVFSSQTRFFSCLACSSVIVLPTCSPRCKRGGCGAFRIVNAENRPFVSRCAEKHMFEV